MQLKMSDSRLKKALLNADQLELAAMRSGVGVRIPLAQCLSDEEIENSISEDEELPFATGMTEVEKVEVAEMEKDNLVNDVRTIVNRRLEEAGIEYPFVMEGNSLIYMTSRSQIYEFCLVVALSDISRAKLRPLQQEFERFAGELMARFLGPAWKAYRVGYPAADELDPRDIKAAVTEMAKRCPNQWEWGPNVTEAEAGTPKDADVDVIVWRRSDSRNHCMYFLGNCAAGRLWHESNKHLEKPSARLGDYIQRPKPFSLNDFFVSAFDIVNEAHFADASKSCGMVFDRIRISRIVSQMSFQEAASIEAALRKSFRELLLIAGVNLFEEPLS